MTFRHPVRGFVIGPVVAPIGYWLAMTADAIAHGVSVNAAHTLRELTVITAFGIPAAYATALLWGAPVTFALHRFGALRVWTLMLAGALGGAIVALCFAAFPQGDLLRVRMPWPLSVLLGALAGAACWWAGRGPVAPAASTGGGD